MTARERTTRQKGFTPAVAIEPRRRQRLASGFGAAFEAAAESAKTPFRPPRRRESTGAVVRTGSEWATRTAWDVRTPRR